MAQSAAPEESARKLPRILHVEDDPDDALLVLAALRKGGLLCYVRNYEDGHEPMKYLGGASQYADRAKYPLPDLVLLDLKLPTLSGFEVLAWARAQEHLKHLPIVVLGSSPLAEDISRARELGATAHLPKTPEFREVVEYVSGFLSA